MLTPSLISLTLLAYILGSVSSAIILSKLMGFPDPRSEGSLNPGATNVMRIAGKKAAAITLISDMLKGFAPALIAHFIFNDLFIVSIIGFSAFMGHCFPLFYQFKGGKGVATAIGATIALNWISGLFVIVIWLIVAKGLKISSLAALIAFLALPFFTYWQFNSLGISTLYAVLLIILTIRHKANILRLINGTES